jgi:hypothetical protein
MTDVELPLIDKAALVKALKNGQIVRAERLIQREVAHLPESPH